MKIKGRIKYTSMDNNKKHQQDKDKMKVNQNI